MKQPVDKENIKQADENQLAAANATGINFIALNKKKFSWFSRLLKVATVLHYRRCEFFAPAEEYL